VACVVLAPPFALRKVEAGSLLQTGQLFERSLRYPMATGLYRRAVELDPRDPRSDLQVGKAALEASRLPLPAGEIQGWLDLAQDAFERTLRLAPYDPDQLANLARLEVRLSEGVAADQAEVHKARADELYQRVLRLSPNNVALLDEYAYFQYTRRGQLDEAAANLKRSMLLDPTYYFTYVVLGEIYVVKGQAPSADRLGSYRIAIAYYDRALQLQFSARIAVAAALLSVEAQDKPTAVRRLEDSLRFEPGPEPSRKVHAQLARLYQELGQPAKAAEHAALLGPPPAGAPAPASKP
jgi:tetratricopeptide (TPR) repeat protein